MTQKIVHKRRTYRAVQPPAKPVLTKRASVSSILIKRSPAKPSAVFDAYWRFAAERQAIYHRRVQGEARPWTKDKVLTEYKFTNAYRAADRVSQYLIHQVLYRGQHSIKSTVLRALFFKLFNKIDTWRLLEETVGEISDKTYDIDRFKHILDNATKSGASIYSGAYIMPSGPRDIRKARKHHMHLLLLKHILSERLPEQLARTKSMSDAYAILLSIPSIGPFLAYQFTIDLNYSEILNFSEMDFVVPGPGALDGIRKCFIGMGDYTEADIIRWTTDRQEIEFARRGIEFPSLWGRPLQLIDCQNLFCEISKYTRVTHPNVAGISGRTRIKQKFTAHAGLPRPWFPPKWKLNDRIATELQSAPGSLLL